MTELIRVSEAAKRLGKTRQAIYNLIENDVLKVIKISGYILINADDLNKPEVRNPKIGRPHK